MTHVDHEKIEAGVRRLLEGIGEDIQREGLRDTPDRVARLYQEMFSGLHASPHEHVATVFAEDHEEVVLVKDLSFVSVCEHHLIPFVGRAHVAYIPQHGTVTGLSKLARTVDTIASQPQLQERMTSTIADTIVTALQPHGVIVVLEAEHLCMAMRGVKKVGAMTITSAARGHFVHEPAARSEVFSLIKQ